MPDVHLGRVAERDVAGIAAYTIARFGIQQARTYRDGLIDCLETLARNPEMGRDAATLGPGVRRFSYRHHEIFYTIAPDGVFIARVLHGRMSVLPGLLDRADNESQP